MKFERVLSLCLILGCKVNINIKEVDDINVNNT